jgi:thioredoxin-like negative regulator of GroEL
LEEIDRRVKNLIAESMPPGLRLAQAVLEAKGEAEAEALLAASPERIDEEFLSALLATAERLQQSDQLAEADRIRDLHRRAVRLSMRRKLTSE